MQMDAKRQLQTQNCVHVSSYVYYNNVFLVLLDSLFISAHRLCVVTVLFRKTQNQQYMWLQDSTFPGSKTEQYKAKVEITLTLTAPLICYCRFGRLGVKSISQFRSDLCI